MSTAAHLIVLSPHCIVDTEHDTLIKNELKLHIPRLEAKLIYCLSKNMGHPVSGRILVEALWGSDGVSVSRNALHHCVYRTRRIVEEDRHHPKLLLPVKGYGYVLCPS